MIQLEKVNKSFGEIVALKDVSVKLDKGEVVALLGSSGSGKSTLLRCINGLESVSSGRVIVDNIELKDSSLNEIRKKVGMVFQQFNLFPHMSVEENLRYAPVENMLLTRAGAESKAKEVLKLVGLEHKSGSMPSQLSGGQKQRIAIARALMMDPEIILFDEPTSALDPENIKDVVEIFAKLQESGITIIAVTHNVDFARKVSTRVLFVDHGLLLDDSSSEKFFTKPKSQRARLFLRDVDIFKEQRY